MPVVSMVDCLEEVDVQLGMEQSNIKEPQGNTCGQRESPGRKDREAGRGRTAWSLPRPSQLVISYVSF